MSSLMGLLSVQGERRSRSKSPSGRERSRSRSRDDRSEPKKDSGRRKSTRKSESSSESEDDDKRYKRKSSRVEEYRDKSDYSSHGRRRDSDYMEERSPTSRSRRSKRRSDSDSESESEDDRRGKGRDKRTMPKIVPASPATAAKVPASALKSPVQVSSPYGQVNAYSYAAPPGHVPQPPGAFPDRPHGALSETRHMSYGGPDTRYAASGTLHSSQPEQYRQRALSSSGGQQYAQVGQFQYAQVDPRIAYKDPNSNINMYAQPVKPQVVSVDPRRSDSRILDKRYTEDKYKPRDDDKDKRYVEDKYRSRDRDSDRKERKLDDMLRHDDDKTSARRLSRLSIGAATGAATLGVAAAAGHGTPKGDKPPPSPLLEAYKGTYQSISPMPSALVLAGHKFDSDVSDVELDSDDSDDSDDPEAERRRKIKRLEKEREILKKKEKREHKEHEDKHEPVEYERRRPSQIKYETRTPDEDVPSSVLSPRTSRKKVNWYAAEDDAKDIAAALKGSKPPNLKPLLRILPQLNMEDLEALKAEYKNHATIGGQGINMSKHIKARVTGYFGKAAYACSLGQYEGDAYWANCFYQSGASRQELLIESLMGRTNQQIREIKNFFKDKKYDDDLEKCLKAELKADKFRTAILLALEEKRQAESLVLDPRLIKHDVYDLYDALHSPGGESAMIQIVVVRSDSHLREVLRQYEHKYGQNFAREMINKSRNLVGETLAHILNGALNRSMRDALLLHQAIAETAPGKERAELLISRLVRLHWEPKHLEKVKAQYAQRYGVRIEDAIVKEIQSNMKTEEGIAWTNFCLALIKSSEQ